MDSSACYFFMTSASTLTFLVFLILGDLIKKLIIFLLKVFIEDFSFYGNPKRPPHLAYHTLVESLDSTKVFHLSVQYMWNVAIAIWTSRHSMDRAFGASLSLLFDNEIFVLEGTTSKAFEVSLNTLCFFEESWLGGSTEDGLFCPLAATMDAAINIFLAETWNPGGRLTVDP